MNNILIERNEGELIINVRPLENAGRPTAAILNYSGELIERLDIEYGVNKVGLQPYSAKNYSIRITNGKNVITQKI